MGNNIAIVFMFDAQLDFFVFVSVFFSLFFVLLRSFFGKEAKMNLMISISILGFVCLAASIPATGYSGTKEENKRNKRGHGSAITGGIIGTLLYGLLGGIYYGYLGSRIDAEENLKHRNPQILRSSDFPEFRFAGEKDFVAGDGMEEAANRQKRMVLKENRQGSSLLVSLREKYNEALDEANRQTDQRPEKAEAENKTQ